VSAPAGKRRKSRELAMQMLFQADVGKQSPEQVRKTFWEARDEVDPDVRGFAEDLYRVANVREDEIAELITKHAQNWRMERMPAVDRSVLRMAIGEMLGFTATPAPIVINEALEIARRYSAPESLNFLNGVLDAVARSRREGWQPAENRRG
jgi:N utilization substance protein B